MSLDVSFFKKDVRTLVSKGDLRGNVLGFARDKVGKPKGVLNEGHAKVYCVRLNWRFAIYSWKPCESRKTYESKNV